MLNRTTLFSLAALLSMTAAFAQPADQGKMLAHNVFFSLADKSDAAKTSLVNACHKYLKDHPGTVFFAAGTLAGDMTRDVNDRDFDVSLHVVFRGKADHDRYQAHPRHQKFIEENRPKWTRVRVFDSYVK